MISPACKSFLGRAVRSVLKQTERDLKVIVIADGSMHHTVNVALRIAEQDERVEFCGMVRTATIHRVAVEQWI